MIIEDYDFGIMRIDGKVYKKDLIILPDKIVENWIREEGHFLQIQDLFEIFGTNLEILIIGTGAYGLMKVSEDLIKKLKDMEIDYHISNTFDAVKKFNEIENKIKAGAFHLTC
ncbi:MAG TPA: MTH938/NDUFAF3 family protein [Caldisericia bacterium]|nr:MTH938/NDUFAF3 family protein [Caldisericia bacterium]HQL66448.1 MTH938/NDUFAF3 family protein [Caldisericia bacterium]